MRGMSAHGDRPPAAVTFDAIGAGYEKAFAHNEAHLASLDWLLERLGPGSRVLDVGSGTGRPTAGTLASAGHRVLGVDISPVMTGIAARQVPSASFRCADIREVPLEDGSFDAVCAFESMLQMRRDEQAELVRRLARALVPGGFMVLATLALDADGVDAVFMGQPVRVTSFAADDFAAMVGGAGLEVLSREDMTFTPDHPDPLPEPQVHLRCRRTAATS